MRDKYQPAHFDLNEDINTMKRIAKTLDWLEGFPSYNKKHKTGFVRPGSFEKSVQKEWKMEKCFIEKEHALILNIK